MGSLTQSGSAGVNASLVSNSITWRAVRMGTGGNSITIAVVAGGTAGAEVVTVTGNAISVQVESTVSTRTQVLTAVQASADASALVTISVASGGTAASLLSATPLASGATTALTSTMKGATAVQIDTGLFEITLADTYPTLLSSDIMLQKASATDIKAQMVSAAPSTTGILKFRTVAVATATNLASGDVIYIRLTLRNSSG